QLRNRDENSDIGTETRDACRPIGPRPLYCPAIRLIPASIMASSRHEPPMVDPDGQPRPTLNLCPHPGASSLTRDHNRPQLFLIAGFVCACAAMCYAEMASTVTASGSAYTYSRVVLGQMAGWVIGWSLILEYSLVVSAVAVSWSGYAAPLLRDWLGLPMALMQGPHAGGIANIPALFIIIAVGALLLTGAKKSATLNLILVAVKLSALALFVW